MGDPKVEFASVWNDPKLAFRKGNMEGKRSIMVLGCFGYGAYGYVLRKKKQIRK